MTESDLQAIEARANAATEGPWDDVGTCNVCDELHLRSRDRQPDIYSARPEDFKFIAHARTDVPALVAEVRKLRRQLAKSEEIPWDFSVGFGCRGDD